jgi:hypothetical protein
MKKDDNDKGKTGVLKRWKSQKRIVFGIEKRTEKAYLWYVPDSD